VGRGRWRCGFGSRAGITRDGRKARGSVLRNLPEIRAKIPLTPFGQITFTRQRHPAPSRGAARDRHEACSPQDIQFSTFKPRMRLNSAALAVTMVSPPAQACAAIRRSFPPIGFPVASSSARILPYSASAGASNGRMSILASSSSTAFNHRFEPLFAQPYRNSTATMMLVQILSSPRLAICFAALPCGFLIRSEMMLVLSR